MSGDGGGAGLCPAENVTVPVLVEIEVGENRSGIIEEADFRSLLDVIARCPHVRFEGIFSHDGNSYGAADIPALMQLAEGAQRRTLILQSWRRRMVCRAGRSATAQRRHL